MIIDPGGDPAEVIRHCDEEGIDPVVVLATHGHFDHVGGVTPLTERYGIPFAAHSADAAHYGNALLQARMFGCSQVSQPPEPQIDLAGEESLVIGEWELGVLHTPGHSPGSVSFVLGEHLFLGDVLFRKSIGRTDLPGGNMETLLASIREKLFPFEDGVVYPGHGPRTTIREEKDQNPFLR